MRDFKQLFVEIEPGKMVSVQLDAPDAGAVLVKYAKAGLLSGTPYMPYTTFEEIRANEKASPISAGGDTNG